MDRDVEAVSAQATHDCHLAPYAYRVAISNRRIVRTVRAGVRKRTLNITIHAPAT